MKTKFTEEELFCIKYLFERNCTPVELRLQIESLIADYNTEFNLVKVKKDFFTELAEKLRLLWPAGEKDGKYPWRDSVPNLAKRLQLLWKVRDLKDYTIDECLTVARRYLAQFENNARYMKTLKYFILRQNENVVGKDGHIHYINNSIFADMLEGNAVEEEWGEVFNENDFLYEVR